MTSLQFILDDGKDDLTLHLIGTIDENANLDAIKLNIGKRIIIDVGQVKSINSYGSREWIRWIKTIKSPAPLSFSKCGTTFLNYVNMVEGFLPPSGVVESFDVPYYCQSCNEITLEIYQSVDMRDNLDKIKTEIACARCGGKSEIDVIIPNYFKFLKHY